MDLVQQLVEVGEALVEVARREPGSGAHRAHTDAGDAVGVQAVERGFDEHLTPLRAALVRGHAAIRPAQWHDESVRLQC